MNHLFLALLSLFTINLYPQDTDTSAHFRIVFYNVENFFDPLQDSAIDYNEFTASGSRRWTWSRYEEKQVKIYKVITAIGEGRPIALAAFAEIENRKVLEDLLENTPLNDYGYQIIHAESKDERGIDLGLIYLPEQFQPMNITSISIPFGDTLHRSRDILYVKGFLGDDSLHILVNHWPSRYGGVLETRELRMDAAKMLRKITDSICQVSPHSAMLIMGDFNDNITDQSLKWLAGSEKCPMHFLPAMVRHRGVKGTLKYQGRWESFDQFLVSDGLFHGLSKLAIQNNTGHIFCPDFLLTRDKKYTGVKPCRTYEGYSYKGGFSDHLPIFIDIYTSGPE